MLELAEGLSGKVVSVSAYESGDIYLSISIDGISYDLNFYKKGDIHETDK